jgi:branched-subunit amino acid transport protein
VSGFDPYPWFAIAAIAVATLLTRASFLWLGDRVAFPPRVERALRYAPACALAAIVAQDVAVRGGVVTLSHDNLRLVATLVAAAWCAWRRDLLGTILVGMGAYTLLRVL